MIQAGFFECDITPPYGADRPASFVKHKVRKIHDPLKVRAMALSDSTKKVVLVGIDNIGTGSDFLQQLKNSLPGIEVIVSASHTHYGGNLRDKFPGIDTADETIRRIVLEETVAHDPNYYEYCMRQTVTAVLAAFENLEDVDFSFGSSRIENLIYNRRIRMNDGTVKTHPGKGNPESVEYAGPVDDSVGVVGVWKKDSEELLGFALNFSCHACISLEGASADFPGVAIETIRSVYGSQSGAVFMQGASGDVTQIDNLSLVKDTGVPVCVKVGRAVGGEAIKLLATSPRGPIEKLEYLKDTYQFRFRPLDEEEIAEAYNKIQTFEESNDYKIASTLVQQSIVRKAQPHPETELGVLQLGPLLMCSTPCEMFARFALDFKEASKFPMTWFAQLSFIRCYIPTADAFDPEHGGGYEASTAHFVPETGDEMMEIVTKLAGKLTPEQLPQPICIPPQKSVWGFNFKRKDMNNK